MYELVEPRLRQLVADRLGVEAAQLTLDVSLLDDLAADSLDLVDIAICLETTLGVEVPETAFDQVRTYGDLLAMTLGLLGARHRVELRRAGGPPAMWARVLPPGGETTHVLERAGWLTPYTVETLVEDAVQMGRGTCLELTIDAQTSDSGLAQVEEQFIRLAARGVSVVVRRDTGPSVTHLPPHAAAW
jgi:acyl carrier protein